MLKLFKHSNSNRHLNLLHPAYPVTILKAGIYGLREENRLEVFGNRLLETNA
jgi:hypothetical protein